MIQFTNLTKQFGSVTALTGLSAHLHGGRVIVLMGPNASGKSTLLKCLLGIVQPTSGTVEVLGQPTRHEWAYRQTIGYMPQLNHLPENLTTAQLFEMMLAVRPVPPGTELDYALYHTYELDQWRHRRLGTLSGGTRQKINAALAFLFAPRIVVLDEPSVGLDPLAAEILKERIRQFRADGRLVLLTSHQFPEAEEVGDDLLYLRDGRIELALPIAELLARTGQASLGQAVLAHFNHSSSPAAC